MAQNRNAAQALYMYLLTFGTFLAHILNVEETFYLLQLPAGPLLAHNTHAVDPYTDLNRLQSGMLGLCFKLVVRVNRQRWRLELELDSYSWFDDDLTSSDLFRSAEWFPGGGCSSRILQDLDNTSIMEDGRKKLNTVFHYQVRVLFPLNSPSLNCIPAWGKTKRTTGRRWMSRNVCANSHDPSALSSVTV